MVRWQNLLTLAPSCSNELRDKLNSKVSNATHNSMYRYYLYILYKCAIVQQRKFMPCKNMTVSQHIIHKGYEKVTCDKLV